jgi:hypothetical protein
MSLTSVGMCEICGDRQTVRHAVVAWVQPVGGRYESIDRCVDVAACKERVAMNGDPWPVIDPKVPA